MRKVYLLLTALFLLNPAVYAQHQNSNSKAKKRSGTTLERPKLIVGLVVDQMRWDYLYRYYDRYTKGGFKRLVNEGFSAENTMIPYLPTYTACGHASIYTGSVPAINGIIGNNWYDPELRRDMYCAEDKSVKSVGTASTAGEMSPKNMLTTTITDELKLATNFKSKVIGISMKDRGAILPAGHSANAAYWYDGSNGNWISSTYYMPQLPAWMEAYNQAKHQNKFYEKNWETLYPINTYTQSTSDENAYEGRYKGESGSSFPHKLTDAINKNYDLIRSTPFGNTMTLDMAKLLIENEKMGQTGNTDFLAVSCSSTDYVGHQFGPNSIEAEDTYLRLDKDLEAFFNYLDKTIGKGNYLFFLSADHGAAHVPKFMEENRMPGGVVSNKQLASGLNKVLEDEFKIQKSVIGVMNNQVIFNKPEIEKANADFDSMKKTAIRFLKQQAGILNVVDITRLNDATLPDLIKQRIENGYNARRSGDIYFLLNPNWFDGGRTGTTHGSWNPYDAHIPAVFMGWKVKPGKTNKPYHMTDIAPTIAAMLQIQMPNGTVGQPITELTDN